MSGRRGRRSEKGVIVEPIDLGGLGGLDRVRPPEMEIGMRERDVDVVPGLAAASWSCLEKRPVDHQTSRYPNALLSPAVAHQSPGCPGQLPGEHGLVSDVNTRSGDAEATTATATATRR